jgi:hypothetical protein
MHFEIAEPDVDFFHLAGFFLFFGWFDLLDDLAADYFGIKLNGFVEILGAGSKRSDSFDIEHGGLLKKITVIGRFKLVLGSGGCQGFAARTP